MAQEIEKLSENDTQTRKIIRMCQGKESIAMKSYKKGEREENETQEKIQKRKKRRNMIPSHGTL